MVKYRSQMMRYGSQMMVYGSQMMGYWRQMIKEWEINDRKKRTRHMVGVLEPDFN